MWTSGQKILKDQQIEMSKKKRVEYDAIWVVRGQIRNASLAFTLSATGTNWRDLF